MIIELYYTTMYTSDLEKVRNVEFWKLFYVQFNSLKPSRHLTQCTQEQHWFQNEYILITKTGDSGL